MKKVILTALALVTTASAIFAQAVGTGIWDDFKKLDGTTPVEYGDANGGIFWFSGDSPSPYTFTRTEGKLSIATVNATLFKPFGLGFGDSNGPAAGGTPYYLDLAKNTNANISISMKNTSLTDSAHVTMQLEDNSTETIVVDGAAVKKGAAGYMPDISAVTESWSDPGRKQKIGFLLLPGQSRTVSINLSNIVGALGGLSATAFTCGSPLACPTTSYFLDPSKLAKILFFINGDASLANPADRVYPYLTPYDGTLEITDFKIGTLATNAGLNKDGITSSIDETVNVFNNETVTVYNTLGKVVASGKYNELSLEKGQLYIIRSASKTQKVILN